MQPQKEAASCLKSGVVKDNRTKPHTIGVLIIRIVFWGPFYYNHNMDPPK